ncbi:MAG: Fic family protein [Oscillospiraceae bacterium]|nr:Fic family protein [Oscillospiraceae bacterium]
MQRKYSMTREENIFWAKRNIVDYIWKSARLEGLSVTFPETDAIYNGISVSNVKIEEMIAVNNIKHAWQFVLDNLDIPIDYHFICRINQHIGGDNLIANSGFLRNIPVRIGGTSWKPDMPIESQIREELADIFDMAEPTDRAITLMLYLMRKQMFMDGNKRTAMLAANQVLISHGCGVVSVPIENILDFSRLLVEYYEIGDAEKIKSYIYNQCIDGVDFTPMM